MKYIKKVVIILWIVLTLFTMPNVCYGSSLTQVLNESNQLTVQNKTQGTLSNNIKEAMVDNLELMQQEMVSIQEEINRIQEQLTAKREKGQRIVSATYEIASPGADLCAAWVSLCYQRAGLGYPSGDADDMYWNFCHSSNRDELVSGMIIAVPSHTQSGYAGLRYGHVGIIIERDGQWYVRDNIGYVNECSLDEWIAFYGTTYTPQWGFAGNI